MTAHDATFWAAIIAATASIINLILAGHSARAAEARVARRTALATTYSTLGALLYELIAISKKMTQAKTDETFEKHRKKAEETAKHIDELRRKTRYALWGLDDGFRTILWMPAYISHHKKTRTEKRACDLIHMGTSLRKSMDTAIMNTYTSGTPPTRLHRATVWLKAWKLRRYFIDGSPNGLAKDHDET